MDFKKPNEEEINKIIIMGFIIIILMGITLGVIGGLIF